LNSVFALAFYNELEYRHLNERTGSDDDAAKSSKNVVNIGPVSMEIMLLICVSSFGYWTKIDLHSSRWHCQTRWTIRMPMGALKVTMTHVHLA